MAVVVCTSNGQFSGQPAVPSALVPFLARRLALHLSSVLTSDHRPAFPLGSGCQPAFSVASVHANASVYMSDLRPAFPLRVGSVNGLPPGIGSYGLIIDRPFPRRRFIRQNVDRSSL